MNRFSNNLEYPIKIAAMILISNFAGYKVLSSQPKITNKYRLTLINNTKILQKQLAENSEK
jgi:hypothetical protein